MTEATLYAPKHHKGDADKDPILKYSLEHPDRGWQTSGGANRGV